MSARWDRSQRFSFEYQNLYLVYKKGMEAAKNSEVKDIYDLKAIKEKFILTSKKEG